ncbi:MAG TPA: S-methyl-5-thioribose-1-phosphate isomerase [Solirubrobacteraceae bacterium]|nr:S-methyl-5-thioribose-1-phosphate isomerase [Solirubrobacteraceae bacterium]
MATGPAPIDPLRWRDGALELLDQRRLPGAVQWLRCAEVEQVAEAIETLAVRGAPLIGLAAAYGLALADDVPAAARRLAATRPTAINLGWALERGERHHAGGGDLLELAHEMLRDQREADRRMGEHGAVLFGPGERVLTHCNAGALATGGRGTALGVITTAFAAGRVAHVWVDETRPLLQGARLTAWELERAGAPYAIVSDSSAGLLMMRGVVDRIVVGADRIAANGDVANKIGTYSLAVLADRHDVPFHVAAPRSTIDPATPCGGQIPIEERDAAEVTVYAGVRTAPAGAEARNWAFDVTPAALITSIITEDGVWPPSGLGGAAGG